jgi:hypothetical protein
MGVFGVMSRTTDVPDPGLEPVQVIHSPYATHIRYRLGRPAYYGS